MDHQHNALLDHQHSASMKASSSTETPHIPNRQTSKNNQAVLDQLRTAHKKANIQSKRLTIRSSDDPEPEMEVEEVRL